MLPRALSQNRAGQGRVRGGQDNPGEPFQPRPTCSQTGNVAKTHTVPHWDLRKLKPCDATGRDEARDTQEADDRSSTARLHGQGISQLVNFPRS